MQLVITRPRLDAEPLAVKLQQRGYAIVIAPVLEIVARQNVVVPERAFQGVCVTSANGVRCFEGEIDLHLPVYAVGPQSASAARTRGFQSVTDEGGDVQGLVNCIRRSVKPSEGALLYLSGSETSGDLEGHLRQAGYDIVRLVTYDAIAQDLTEFRADISRSHGVLLYSPRSAKLWQAQILKLNLATSGHDFLHLCLSGQVAAALSPQSHTLVAREPTESAMLALLDLHQKGE